ncbi:hypothetical protein NW762_009089 [Fusarium torreyae]|uniref:NADH:flavin oxidoreductase/NADH oxidase N-terminal domain-containing protein n=1 Tax=Fusarium torreyae TaxID=1237075 RepID=A0A9W8RVB8_9HYPO|nr:hypothetical protein NW762_009089 [Fusarium torreyae]
MSVLRPTKLFDPIKVGALDLKHRVVLAPLTRGRADASAVPAPYASEYYSQRATPGGLLITEGTFIALEGAGRAFSPGIYSKEQIEAWKKVTAAVHAKGGYIFCQLWALGRIAVPELVPAVYSPGSQPFIEEDAVLKELPAKFTVMTESDIDRFVQHYRQAAINAIEAGFDGVELHGANGYLLDQFLQSTSNDRKDSYGGSVENRIRFPLRVVNAVSEAIGPERVGVRMSPFTRFQGMREAEPLALFVPWAQAIVNAQPSLAYVHAIEPRADGSVDTPEHLRKAEDTLVPIRDVVTQAGIRFIVAGGYTPEKALEHTSETDDLVAFGRHFIPNPDLPERIKNGWLLTKYDRSVFYEVNEVGYIDYAVYSPEAAKV